MTGIGTGMLVGTMIQGNYSFENGIWRSEGIAQRLAPPPNALDVKSIEEKKVAEMKQTTMPEPSAGKGGAAFGFEYYA